MRYFVLPLLFITAACAQQTTPTGTVTGHITCSDTNLPARLATVTLQPIRELPPQTAEEKEREAKFGGQPNKSLTPIQTRLDGTFVIPRVALGSYYVIVQHPGYLSPASQFTREEIDRPTPEIRERIAKLIPTVTVTANGAATLDLRLYRAASVSGTIRYDDGTPAPGQSVGFYAQDKAGKWTTIHLPGVAQSDDLGHFRISGIPAGEYLVGTYLSLVDSAVDTVFGGNGSMAMSSRYSLEIYFPNVFTQTDARHLKLAEGEESSGTDLTIPVTKLHVISGSLVAAGSGRVINAGTVKLLSIPDNKQVASAKIDPDESTFRFEFVPEGDYTIHIDDARDVTRERPAVEPGSFPFNNMKETVIRFYGSYEGPFKVETDMTGINLPIPPRPAKP